MKWLLTIALLGFWLSVYAGSKDGYSIKFRVKGLKDTVCYLANYYGEKQYYRDTATVDKNGNFKFEGKETLPGGIYSIIFPDKKNYFEFLVSEQHFMLETDTADLLMNMKVKGSKENALFYEYRKFIASKNKEAEPIRRALNRVEGNRDSTKYYQGKLNVISQSVKDYKVRFMQEHPDKLLAVIFRASAEPEVPETPTLPNGEKDSLFPYLYFKQHYFDGVDFTDERLLRTPVFHRKLKHYMKKLVLQIPDSINKEADLLAEKTRPNKEMFKFVVHYVTNTYEQSKIMGMDAVFVYMAEKYYMTGEAYWLDSAKLAKLTERAMQLKPTLIGKTAPNLFLQDTSGKWHTLHGVKAKLTILYFWDPDCGHCKKATPKLRDKYPGYKKKGIEFFAVGCELENDKWKKYIRENKLDWINVSDSPEYPNAFRSVYDVFSTPVIYLLDEEKKIIAKRLSDEQLDHFIDQYFEKQ